MRLFLVSPPPCLTPYSLLIPLYKSWRQLGRKQDYLALCFAQKARNTLDTQPTLRLLSAVWESQPTQSLTHTRTHTHTNAQALTQMHKHSHKRLHTHTHLSMLHTSMHIHTQVCTKARTNTVSSRPLSHPLCLSLPPFLIQKACLPPNLQVWQYPTLVQDTVSLPGKHQDAIQEALN